MAKKSAIQKNMRRQKMIANQAPRRMELKQQALNASLPMAERVKARIKLDRLARNGSPVRFRNRCVLTGRPRGNYRKLGICRIKLREYAWNGEIPGMVKSSW